PRLPNGGDGGGEGGAGGAVPGPAEAVRALLAWGEAQGIDARAIEVRVDDTGNRSVVARTAIAADQRIVAVPRRALITELDVADAPIGAALARAAPPLDSGHTPIALWLATERRDPSSRWRPYLDALPAAVPLPWFTDDDLLLDLRGTHTWLANDVVRGGVIADHGAIVSRLPRVADLGLGELAWGRAIASSRLFRVKLGGVDRLALAPIADLFDHGRADATWRYDEERGEFAIVAKRAIAAGEPIQLSYGRKGLSRFFTGYGFVPADLIASVAAGGEPDPDDPRLEDVAAITFPGLRDDPRAALAVHLVWGHDLDRPLTMTAPATFDERARRVLSVARLLAADSREVSHAIDRGRFVRNELAWLGPRNERAALERIETAALAARTHLAATADADRRLLEDPDIVGWPRVAAALRTAERAVLDRWAELLAVAAPVLGDRSPWSWRRIATERESAGLRHPLAPGYLRAVADELP
ncbi:MAG TPA: hypothetical protein VHE35_29980, partial [Kofleriaceae bacterium]|nr:hypothetical protein [Kofleriaceae bacterium]